MAKLSLITINIQKDIWPVWDYVKKYPSKFCLVKFSLPVRLIFRSVDFFKDLRLRNNLKRWPSVANRIKLNGNIYDDSWEVSELTILRFPLNFNTAQLKTRIWNSYLEYS